MEEEGCPGTLGRIASVGDERGKELRGRRERTKSLMDLRKGEDLRMVEGDEIEKFIIICKIASTIPL